MLKKLVILNKTNVVPAFVIPLIIFILAQIIASIAVLGFGADSTFYLYGVYAFIGNLTVAIASINIVFYSFTVVLSMSVARKPLIIATIALCFLLSFLTTGLGILLAEIEKLLVFEVFMNSAPYFTVAGGQLVESWVFPVVAAAAPVFGIIIGTGLHRFGPKVFFLFFLGYLSPILHSQNDTGFIETLAHILMFALPILFVIIFIISIFYLRKAPVK